MLIFGIMAIGLNIVAGFAGLLDLGYVAFYAIGAYTAAFLASPHFGERQHRPVRQRRQRLPGHPPAVLDRPPGRGARRRHVRRTAGRSDAAAARRLPGHRDPRLRRDRPGLLQEPGGHHVQLLDRRRDAHQPAERQPDRRPARDQPDRSVRHPGSRLRGDVGRRRVVLRDGAGASSPSSSRATSSARGWVAPGAPSARTRPPPR